jgi:hypothetical protein
MLLNLSLPMIRFRTRTLFFFTTAVALFCAVLVPIYRSAQEAARGMSCRNNLKQIGLGLMNYESACRSLPIATEIDSAGKPWRSWRSRIYPTYIEAMAPIYDGRESWDSVQNLRLLNGTPISLARKDGTSTLVSLRRFPLVFTCPSCDSNKQRGIHYVVVSGEATAFPKLRSVKLADIRDGLENTILVVESITCNPDWTEPRDLEFDMMSFRVNATDVGSISSHHPRGPLVCFADGAVYHLSESASEREVKALLTIAGEERVTREDLLSRGILIGY